MKTITSIESNENFSSKVQAWQLKNMIGETVTIHGSVYKIRKMHGFAFVLLRSGGETLQCVYEETRADFPLEKLTEECCIKAVAFVKEEPRSGRGFDLQLLHVQILSLPARHSPVVINQKTVNASLETLLNYRPITLRNQRQAAIFKIQEALADGIRRFLKGQHFTEIHTPKIVSEGAEGGTNIFHLKYFEQDAFLAQSPQFYKQMMVGVFERVFEIGPVFRAEKHDTSRHLNEYTSVDFEMGFIEDFQELMAMETGMLRSAIASVKEQCPEEATLLGIRIPEITEIPCLRFQEAKELLQKEGCSQNTPMDFDPEEEKKLCRLIREKTGSEFVFVTHYPSAKRPFYAMNDPQNPEETLSFDLLFRGMEVTTGGQRIHSYETQVEKCARKV